MENNNYVGKIYLDQLSVEKPNINTWCTQVRDLLYSCGFEYVWANQRVYGCKEFLRLFSLGLHDMYITCKNVCMYVWHCTLGTAPQRCNAAYQSEMSEIQGINKCDHALLSWARSVISARDISSQP